MSDQEILYRFFDQVKDVMLDGSLTAEQRCYRLRGLLGDLSELMDDRVAAYSLWRKLMASIQPTRH